MWFTEVRPRRPGAAALDIAVAGDRMVNVDVGDTWFELWGNVEDSLPHLADIVAAVIAGRVEEAGRGGRCLSRIYAESGPVSVGHAHLPLPWRLRQVRRYESYG